MRKCSPSAAFDAHWRSSRPPAASKPCPPSCPTCRRSLPAAVIVGQHSAPESALIDILASRTLLPVQWVRGERLHPGRVTSSAADAVEVCRTSRACSARRGPDPARQNARCDAALAPKLRPAHAGARSHRHGQARRRRRTRGQETRAARSWCKRASAAQPSMPRAAIDMGAADLVLPLSQLAGGGGSRGGRALSGPRNESEAREVLLRRVPGPPVPAGARSSGRPVRSGRCWAGRTP